MASLKPDELARYLLSRDTRFMAFPYHGDSMRGTFQQGDILLVDPVVPGYVRPGDIIAFRSSKSNGEVMVIVH